ncbi:ATP-binding protein [Streptomyces sp. NPDC004012]
MDPNQPGPEEYGHDGAHATPRQRPPRDPMTSDFVQPAPALARTVRLVTGDFLVTVNPVDGSEIEVCPPGQRPEPPAKHTAAERAEKARAARPPVPPGPARPQPPLLMRQEERERLVRLLARGRSVRLTGPSGSGRTALLDLVAEDCADLAPDGVIRLSGCRRSASDLLYELFAAVYDAPLFRPGRAELARYLQDVGAVVVLDDLEFGGSALDELLDATPECAFLLAATPEVPAPSADSRVEEVFLGGLDRPGSLELLERAVGRDLTEDEANWAGDLWFESEGLPLRFMQAGALLRQRDRQRAEEDAVDEFGVFQHVPEQAGDPAPGDAADGPAAPLPSLAEAAAAAPLLASRLSPSARETLKFAVALGGEVPHQTHLPALVDDTHADAALAELADCALVSQAGSRYRLAAGVTAQLEAAGYATGVEEYALKAAQHYSWWAGHPSVTPARVVAEADALLAALAALVPLTTREPAAPQQEGNASSPGEDEEEAPAVQLARQAAPAFAAGLDWGAWERALRFGAEASRLAGSVGEQSYFHHELGILALCAGQVDRARAELEASIGLRGALADKRGTIAGRRALALVSDRADTAPLGRGVTADEETPDARQEGPASPADGVPAAFAPATSSGDTATLLTYRATTTPAPRPGGLRGVVQGTRRNLVAAGAGAALVAVLGTVVTLGMTDNHSDTPSDNVRVGPSASQDPNDDGLGADKPDKGSGGGKVGVANAPTATAPGPDGVSGTPTPGTTGGMPSDAPTDTTGATPSKSPSRPTSLPPTRPTTPTSKPTVPSNSPSPQSPTPTSSGGSSVPTSTPPVSDSASGPASSSAPAATTSSVSGGSGTPSSTGSVI